MSQKNSRENKKLRREAKLAKRTHVDRIQTWIPYTDQYGFTRYSPVLVPARMLHQ